MSLFHKTLHKAWELAEKNNVDEAKTIIKEHIVKAREELKTPQAIKDLLDRYEEELSHALNASDGRTIQAHILSSQEIVFDLMTAIKKAYGDTHHFLR